MNRIRIDRKNNHFQHVEVIKRNRKKRSKSSEFFVEGAKSINNAVKNGWTIETLVYSYQRELSSWAEEIVSTTKATTLLEVSNELMDDLSDKENPTEILAIVKFQDDELCRIPVKDDMVVVVFDRPSNYGNLGALIRTCEALKVDGIIVSGHAADIYDVRTLRASMGTFFSVPIVRVEGPDVAIKWFEEIKLKVPNFKVVGSTAQTEDVVDDVDLTGGLALLLGNETSGLSFKFKETCDELVKIPMYGMITSFNVACAASIMIYEIDRQRRRN